MNETTTKGVWIVDRTQLKTPTPNRVPCQLFADFPSHQRCLLPLTIPCTETARVSSSAASSINHKSHHSRAPLPNTDLGRLFPHCLCFPAHYTRNVLVLARRSQTQKVVVWLGRFIVFYCLRCASTEPTSPWYHFMDSHPSQNLSVVFSTLPNLQIFNLISILSKTRLCTRIGQPIIMLWMSTRSRPSLHWNSPPFRA